MKIENNSLPLDDKKVMEVFRGSKGYQEAVSDLELKEQRCQAAKKRIKLLQEYDQQKNELLRQELEATKAVQHARDNLKNAQNLRNEVTRALMMKKTIFESELGKLEFFLNKTADHALLIEIERLNEYRESFRRGRTIQGHGVRFMEGRVVLTDDYTSNLQERETAIKFCDAEIKRLRASILSGTEHGGCLIQGVS